MRLSRWVAATIAVAVMAAGAPGATAAGPAWAPAATAAIHPGVQTLTEGAQCTANFVFFDASNVYLGQAAHCASKDGNTVVNGCQARAHGLGTPVTISGAEHPGTLVYSSWLAMQVSEERDPDRCLSNDFALVRLHPADRAKVNPTVPFWGGPAGLPNAKHGGDKVYSYGNSSLRLGLSPLSPKEGYQIGSSRGGWTHTVYTATPGIPGDSGSAFLDDKGNALGVLSTVELLPRAGSNGVSDLRLSLDYLAHHSTLRVRLALGTQPFRPGLLPAT